MSKVTKTIPYVISPSPHVGHVIAFFGMGALQDLHSFVLPLMGKTLWQLGHTVALVSTTEKQKGHSLVFSIQYLLRTGYTNMITAVNSKGVLGVLCHL